MIQDTHPLTTGKMDSLYLSQWFTNQTLRRKLETCEGSSQKIDRNPASMV